MGNRKTRILLLVTQGVGIIFVGIFFVAYLAGMLMNPSTTVLHSEPAFRLSLSVVGVAFLVLMAANVGVAIAKRNSRIQ